MSGSIYKRGKTYTVSFSNGFYENGKRKRYTKSGFKTKKEADKYLFKLNQKYYNGEMYLNDNMLLSDFLEYWLKNYVELNLMPNTVSGYKNNVYKHIIPEIGNLIVSKIKPIDIQEFYIKLIDKGLSSTTIIYIHRNLHSAFKYAMSMNLFYNNCFDFVKPPKRVQYNSVTLTKEQARKLISVAKGTQLYIPIVLGLSLGLRRGEVLGLKWSDFDNDKMTLKIERNANRVNGGMEFAPLKTENSKRTLLLTKELVEILIEHRTKQVELKNVFGNEYNSYDLICCSCNGGFMTTNYIDKNFKKLLQNNNLPVIRFHDLRHTNATLMLENKVPLKVVSSRLGHSSANITLDTYIHCTHQMQENCVDTISDVLFR